MKEMRETREGGGNDKLGTERGRAQGRRGGLASQRQKKRKSVGRVREDTEGNSSFTVRFTDCSIDCVVDWLFK